MPDTLTLLAALLAPVLALMFAALRLRRRVRYPRELLAATRERTPASVLLRTLRLYYDSALDALAAVAIALALGLPSAPGKKALVLDCSRSMLWGTPGDRALDRAAELVYKSGARPFLLTADPSTGKAILKDASALKEEAGSPSGLAYRLENEEPFLGAEYYLLASLRKRGYRDITLITDELGPEPAGFEVVELGWRMARGLYPSSVSADGSGARVRWVSLGGAEPASIRKTSAEGVPAGLPPSSWSIEEEADGFTLWLKEAGSYLLAWDGGHAAFQIPAPAVLRAQGELAQALAEVLVAGAGAKLLPGAAARPGALLLKEGGGRGAKATLSAGRVPADGYVLDPARSLGRLVAVGWERGMDLALAPASLANGDTPLALWSAWKAAEAPAFRDAGPGALPPPDEFWRPVSGGMIDAGAEPARRWPWAAILGILYALKLAMDARLRSRTASKRSGTLPAGPQER